MAETVRIQMDRRAFIGAAAAAMFAGMVVTLTGCDDSTTAAPSGSKEGTVDVTNSHNHTIFITKDQLDAGLGVTLTTSTNGGHEHNLVLSNEDVASIAAGTHFSRDSADAGSGPHHHLIHFNG